MPEALNKLAGLLQDWFAKDGNSPNKLEGLLVEYGGGLGKIDRREVGRCFPEAKTQLSALPR